MDLPDIELKELVTELLAGIRTAPGSALMRGRLGMAYDVNGFPDAAIASYAQAQALDPDDFRWPYFAARLLAEKGEQAEALDALAQALTIDADYAPAWLWRGTWLHAVERFDDALLAFDEARALGAGSEADFGRATVLLARRQVRQALAILEPLAEQAAHPQVQRTLGRALAAAGRTDEARLASARGSAPGPFAWDDPRAAERLPFVRGYAAFRSAQSWSSEGDTDQALPVFERLQARYPATDCGHAEGFFFACNLLNSLSIAYGRAGDIERAIALARQGIAINAAFAPFHFTIADHYRQQRNLSSALRHVEDGLALNPNNGHGHTQKGRYLYGLGRYPEARDALQTAMRLEPATRTTLFYLGLTEVALEDWGSAVQRFRGVVQIAPDFALGHLYHARSLGEARRIIDARQALNTAALRGAPPAEISATRRRLSELEAR